MSEAHLIKLTKLEAAHRQLCTAIELWFNDGDAVSIHALACAAHQIAHDLNKKKKGRPLIFDSDAIKDEYRGEFVSVVKHSANFLKHADRGKAGLANEIELNPDSNELFIGMAIQGLKQLKEDLRQQEIAFIAWHAIHRPDIIQKGGKKIVQDNVPVEVLDWLKLAPKSQYFRVMMSNGSIGR